MASSISKGSTTPYERMRREGLRPSAPVALQALKVCSSSRDIESGRRIHAQLVQSGDESGIFVANTLIDMYCKCGRMSDALRIFEGMEQHTVVTWTALILGFTQDGQGEIALEIFLEMQEQGCDPNRVTFIAALKACAALGSSDERRKNRALYLRKGRRIHSQAMKNSVENDPSLSNTLVDMYGKCGDLMEARRVFDKMLRRSVVSWSAIILGYAENDEPEIALELFQRMQDEEHCAPNRVTFLAALKAAANLASTEEGKQLDGRFVKIKCLERIRELHSRAAKTLESLDTALLNALVDAYGKCGAVVDARKVFDSLARPTVVSWSAIIHGYAHSGDPQLALELFSRMQRERCAPNRATFLAALKACGSLAALDAGRKIEAQIHSARLQGDPLVATSLVDFYGKCGSMEDAQRVFDDSIAASKDLVAWDALIAGYSWQGRCDQVFSLLEKMEREARLKPDAVTFLSILNACIHAGLVEKGEDYFHAMLPKYGIAPSIKHYTCMVDLLGRANRLDEAVTMVLTMPFEPDLRIWMAVLRASKDVEIGKLAFQSILGLDERNMAAYSMMSNVYAVAGMHAESAKLVQAIRAGATAPGSSRHSGKSWWTDPATGFVHTFVAGESSDELELVLDKVSAGGRERSSLDGEAVLCGHSGNLAIARGVLSTPPGASLRVVSDFWICRECHRVAAMLSKVEQRKIICRDYSSRFHVFEDGRCSCSESWTC
ncbi:pentatricopeptide repeat-containing protein DOT4, chloroplastic-like [Selaginella moellendorffii]|uniref:pentatricopeptide repeat-containing protein DOT4, chloroplastic-like n=1 Tax=Selaginella moellendorffii TaxID=88036 RepID=UPI000D1CF00A|nr:pentatricopeptide repeat-containing protein DOT4, chloroplastic-like [Selaginella moellendorffii]|eukprot:XP_024525604.1 pentatricopeptide repeat-containing protein DOT4, chloroplastic-like [Selaginella moellendorffii]